MYGIIGSMQALAGQREALIDILLEGVVVVPGCLSYVVARDPQDSDRLWVSQVWKDESSYRDALTTPALRSHLARGVPLIASISPPTITEPVGGIGLGLLSHLRSTSPVH